MPRGTLILSVFLEGGVVLAGIPNAVAFYSVAHSREHSLRAGARSVAIIVTGACRRQVLEYVLPDVPGDKYAEIIETKCRTDGILAGKGLQGQRHSG